MLKFLIAAALAITTKPRDESAVQLEARVCKTEDIKSEKEGKDFFDKDSGIQEIAGQEQLDKATKEKNALVMIYSPFCPHCVKEKPFFLDFAKQFAKDELAHKFDLISVNIANKNNKGVLPSIEQVPTFMVIDTKGTQTQLPETVEPNFKSFTDYLKTVKL